MMDPSFGTRTVERSGDGRTRQAYRPRRLGAVMVAAVAAMVCYPAAAIGASLPVTGLEGSSALVTDAELGEMRGKYISPGSISFFGISLLTSWQGSDGITTVARLALRVDFLGAGTPTSTMLISWSRDGDPNMDLNAFSDSAAAHFIAVVGPNQVIPVGALDTARGAVQTNVIAGADNLALNGMSIAIIPSTMVDRSLPLGMQAITETTTQNFADGDQLQFRLTPNEIGLVLTSGQGRDSSIQSVNGNLGQSLQHVLLTSDNNRIINSSAIVFGVDSLNSLTSVRAETAMSTFRGFGF